MHYASTYSVPVLGVLPASARTFPLSLYLSRLSLLERDTCHTNHTSHTTRINQGRSRRPGRPRRSHQPVSPSTHQPYGLSMIRTLHVAQPFSLLSLSDGACRLRMRFPVLRSCASFVSYRRPCHRIRAPTDPPSPSSLLISSDVTASASATSTSGPEFSILSHLALPTTDDIYGNERDRTARLLGSTAQTYKTIRYAVSDEISPRRPPEAA